MITQATSLEGARILLLAPEPGSWKATAIIVAGIGAGLYQLGTAPKDTPLGHLIRSAYDYVISETVGFHVDYDKTLGQHYEELRRKPEIRRLPQTEFDAVLEKCEAPIKAMHRPIVISETAEKAEVRSKMEGPPRLVGHPLNDETYRHIAFTERDVHIREIIGRVSSYNVITYKGRIRVTGEDRSIPFEVAESGRSTRNIALITESLQSNAAGPHDPRADIKCTVHRETGRSGRVKRLFVLSVSK